MKRREFVAGLVGAAAWPLLARAQQPPRMRRVGVLTLLSQHDAGGRIAAFIAGMRELGHTPGRTIQMDFRFADGETERLRALAAELIALAPNVMFAGEPSPARAVKALAPNLPIVCPVLTDRAPDLFTSYARPGGSVTGIASSAFLFTRLVELSQEIIP